MGACELTTYATDKRGYGQRKIAGVMQKAHRVAYCEAHGLSLSSIQGLLVLHSCDNPSCVNPEHLSLGTTQENTKQRQERGRGVYQTNPQFKPNVVLTDAQVNWVRQNYRPYHKEFGGAAMARTLGVSQAIVSATITGTRNNR